MKSVLNVVILGMLISSAACLSAEGDGGDDPASSTESDEPSTATAASALRSHPGPDFYTTCSDDPNVCSAGYGSVSIVPDASCVPFGSSHLVTCRFGSVSL